MRIFLIVLAAIIGLAAGAPAEARGGGRFGTEDKIYRIEPIQVPPELASDVPAEWSGGVYLARRASIQWFVLGAWVRDIEYVAVPAGGGDSYWTLSQDQMAALAEAGAISSSSPAYTIPIIDYVFGYSLWIGLALLVLYVGGSMWVTNMRAAGVRAVVGSDFAAFVRLALINAAKSDGDLADAELDAIIDILKSAFAIEATRVQLIEEAASANLKSGQLVAHFQMAQGAMTPDQRGALIRALVAIFAADGQWRSAEKRLLQRYVVALGTDEKQAQRMVNDVARAQAPA